MNEQRKNKLDSRMLTQLGLLIALQVILTRFLSINTPIVRIGFGFLPLAIMGILYGPRIGFVGGIIADLIGAILFPSGAYFPGFTLTTGLTALTYGVFLHQKNYSSKNVLIATLIVCLILNLGLNTFWLSILMNKGYLALIPTRIINNLAMVPIQFILITLVWDKLLLKVRSILIAR